MVILQNKIPAIIVKHSSCNSSEIYRIQIQGILSNTMSKTVHVA